MHGSLSLKEQSSNQLKQKPHKPASFIIADDNTDNTPRLSTRYHRSYSLRLLLVSLVMLSISAQLAILLIVLAAIPTSLVTAFAVMVYYIPFAMSLIIGILVDDATVVREIFNGISIWERSDIVMMDGRMEIGFSAISITS
jgi:HAE1 family hydrophobic/amphiphilic exporter-1